MKKITMDGYNLVVLLGSIMKQSKNKFWK